MGRMVEGVCRNCRSSFEGQIQRGLLPQFCSRDCYFAFSRNPRWVKERFWSKVAIGTPEECWLWTGGVTVDGYGQFYYSRASGEQKVVHARSHRLSYRLKIGKIPKDLQVLHKCDVKLCVNFRHLFLGTHDDNMADMVSKNRQAKGERFPHSKLTERKVRYIRSLVEKGFSTRAIADDTGFSYNSIWDIISGKNWKHV